MEELLVFSYVIFLPYLIVYGDNFSTIVPINIEPNSTIKSGLRYGFQKTSECLNFEKAFLCIQKCLDLHFDVAHADKNCKCTCFVNREKAKYTLPYNSTKWKLGAPTTSIPPWAKVQEKIEATEANDIVDIADDSGHISDQANSTSDTAINQNLHGVEDLTESKTSVAPLATGTESNGADRIETVANADTLNDTTVQDGTTVAVTNEHETTNAER